MTARELIFDVSRDPMERLRFRVLHAFHVLPCSEAARKMTDEDCLRYAAQLIADKNGAGEANPQFDELRYLRLKEAHGNG